MMNEVVDGGGGNYSDFKLDECRLQLLRVHNTVHACVCGLYVSAVWVREEKGME